MLICGKWLYSCDVMYVYATQDSSYVLRESHPWTAHMADYIPRTRCEVFCSGAIKDGSEGGASGATSPLFTGQLEFI